jgi:hypothetical protein
MLTFVKNLFVGKQDGGGAARLNGNRKLLSVSPICHCADVPAYVGRHGTPTDQRTFNGDIAEVAIYDTALENTDIEELFQGKDDWTVSLVAINTATGAELFTEEMSFRPFNSITVAFVGETQQAGVTEYVHRYYPDISNPYSLVFTSYIDAISNNSWINTVAQTARPIGSQYHVNQFQQNSITVVLGNTLNGAHSSTLGDIDEDRSAWVNDDCPLDHITIGTDDRIWQVVTSSFESNVLR